MISPAQLADIAARHGLQTPSSVPERWVGATSRVHPLDDVVLKVSLDRPDAIRSLQIDAALAPYVVSLGIAMPELFALDETRDIIPVPYAIFRRVEGVAPLDREDRSVVAVETWREVGRQIARVHAVTDTNAAPIELRTFRQTAEVDPRPWVDELQAASRLSADDAGWLRDLLERLAPIAHADVPVALCHGDVNAANVLVDERTGRFRALIDWAGAGWLDPVWDFVGVPLEVVPWMLAGHREVSPLVYDDTAEARILWCQVQTRLYVARAETSDVITPINLDGVRRFSKLVDLRW
jgi:aminoglycoside phosphotransferase (APT) family kinase protein